MKLSEKGNFAPPPKLPRYSQQVSETIAAWPGVEARTHWELGDETRVDGADFYVGQEELGHLHLYGEAHVAMPSKLAEVLIASGFAERSRWSSDIVVHDVSESVDLQPTLFLFRLNYDFLRGTPLRELLVRAKQGVPAGDSGAQAGAT